MRPGRTTPDTYRDLESALKSVCDACGGRNEIGLILNDTEARLIMRLMDLNEMGEKFDPSVIPLEIRRDPTGEKRAIESARKLQSEHLERVRKANADGARREALINGETEERRRGVGGPDSLHVIKSGFEDIIAENERIASGRAKFDQNLALDPIGANMAKGAERAKAETELPVPEAPERSGQMDRLAAEKERELAETGLGAVLRQNGEMEAGGAAQEKTSKKRKSRK